MKTRTVDLRDTIELLNTEYEQRVKFFNKCADTPHKNLIHDIMRMADYVTNNHKHGWLREDDCRDDLTDYDIIAHSTALLLDLLLKASNKSKLDIRKKYVETCITNYHQIISVILLLESYTYDTDYPYKLPNVYIKDMFGMICEDDDISIIANPIKYLKKRVVITREADTKIARNLNIMQLRDKGNIYDLYRSQCEGYFDDIYDDTLDRISSIDSHIVDFAEKLRTIFAEAYLYIKRNHRNSYLYRILEDALNYSTVRFDFKNLEQFCIRTVKHSLTNLYDPNMTSPIPLSVGTLDENRIYDDSQPIYVYVQHNDDFNGSLMSLYRECVELLYYTSHDDEDYNIIEIVDRIDNSLELHAATQYSIVCIIHLYIWFRQRFGITLSESVVTSILYDNPMLISRYLNSIIYTGYILNLNERFRKAYHSRELENKVNEFLLSAFDPLHF